MARKIFRLTAASPGRAAVHRGTCCFGRKSERAAMGTKRNHRFGGGLRGGLKGIVGKAKSVLSRTPSPDDEKKTQARGVIVVEALIKSELDAELEIKARLRKDIDDVTVKENEESRTYANPAGHRFDKELKEMNGKLDALLESSAKHSESIASLKAKNAVQESLNDSLVVKNTVQESVNESLSTRVSQLQILSNGFKEIRQRMFTVYKRDIKGQSHLSRPRSIVAGNAHAHDADALTDARLLHEDPFWQDRSTYVELYGLQYDDVLAYHRKFKEDSRVLFQILNAHANMLLQGKILGRPLVAAFQSFLQAVQRLSLEESPTGLESQRTYGAFWGAYAKN